MKPKHRVERTQTPWWWFGQPWARPQATQEMDDEPEPAGQEPDTEAALDSSWFRAMAP